MSNEQWAMNNGQWAMGNEQWAMNNGQWAVGNIPMTNDETSGAVPATSYLKSVNFYRIYLLIKDLG